MKTLAALCLLTLAMSPAMAAEPDNLVLPPGFHASVVAEGLGLARHLAIRDEWRHLCLHPYRPRRRAVGDHRPAPGPRPQGGGHAAFRHRGRRHQHPLHTRMRFMRPRPPPSIASISPAANWCRRRGRNRARRDAVKGLSQPGNGVRRQGRSLHRGRRVLEYLPGSGRGEGRQAGRPAALSVAGWAFRRLALRRGQAESEIPRRWRTDRHRRPRHDGGRLVAPI